MLYPALDVRGVDPDLVLAIVDDCSPSAVEELSDGIAVFFATTTSRDSAREALARALPEARLDARDVDDEDWARRSQQNLTPVTIGRITVTPPWFAADASAPAPAGQPAASTPLTITIAPSMGFGTGHHATTRLCLAALQTLDLDRRVVLDVGTGSGVLAIAASRLGAADALGIDFDPDAIASALENVDLNPEASTVRFEVRDMRATRLPTADVVLANLTGAVLVQNARLLKEAVRPGGTVIVSGLQSHERDEVLAAFSDLTVTWSGEESGWVGIAFRTSQH